MSNIVHLTEGHIFDNIIPHPLHRSIGTPPKYPLFEGSDYVLVNNNSGFIEHFPIPLNRKFNVAPDGVSCMIRKDPSQNPHAVFQSDFLGKGCFVTSILSNDIATVVHKLQRSRTKVNGKPKREDYHMMVFPTVPMTITMFVMRFSKSKWHVCAEAAGQIKESINYDGDYSTSPKIITSNTEMKFLIQMLECFRTIDVTLELASKCRDLLDTISNVIIESTTFEDLVEEKSCAFRIYILLFQIKGVFQQKPLNISGLTKLQFLMDIIDDTWDISERFHVVNLSQLIYDQVSKIILR